MCIEYIMELDPLQAYRLFQKRTSHLYAQLRDRWRLQRSLQKDTSVFQIVIWIDSHTQVYASVQQNTIMKDVRTWLSRQPHLKLHVDAFYFIQQTAQGWEKIRDHLWVYDYRLKPYDVIHVVVKI